MQPLELPRIAAHGPQVPASRPAPQLLNPAGIGDECSDIPRLTADYPVGHSEPAYLTEHGQQLQYADTSSGSEIEGAHPGLFVHVPQGQAMRLGYIHDMDVAAYTGAIGWGVTGPLALSRRLVPARRLLPAWRARS